MLTLRNALVLSCVCLSGLPARAQDASIIVTENILHRLQEHRDDTGPSRALSAAIEVGRPIAFAVQIVVAVFAPFVPTVKPILENGAFVGIELTPQKTALPLPLVFFSPPHPYPPADSWHRPITAI